MSITCTTLTSLSFLFTRVWMHVCSPVTSPLLPHDRPVYFQDMSRVRVLDQNSRAATNSGSRGSVM